MRLPIEDILHYEDKKLGKEREKKASSQQDSNPCPPNWLAGGHTSVLQPEARGTKKVKKPSSQQILELGPYRATYHH